MWVRMLENDVAVTLLVIINKSFKNLLMAEKFSEISEMLQESKFSMLHKNKLA